MTTGAGTDRRKPGLAAQRAAHLAAAVAGILIALVVMVPAPTRAADPTGADPTATDPAAAAEAARLDAYWTGARMRAATPRDLVVDAEAAGVESQAGSSAGRDTAAADGGSHWTAGGAILARSGRIFFSVGSDDFSCSGSVIDDGGDAAYSLVITAAHCAYDREADAFVSDWIYVPAWDGNPDTAGCADTAYGCWYARELVVHAGWVTSPTFPGALRHDYAIAVLGPGGTSGTQLDALGAYALRTAPVSAGDAVDAFGYPAETPYDGGDLTHCAGPLVAEPSIPSWGLTCDMTGGASGGPWIRGSSDPAQPGGEVVSVSSFRPLGDTRLFGPRFDGRTGRVYQEARSATPDATGIDGVVVSGEATAATPFTDIADSTFEADIEWLYESGITKGCAPTLFCPTANVSRGQMAAFLVRALELPPTTTDYFTDDATSTFQADINALRASGITKGCGPTTFCPDANVSRGQMAAFLVRGFHLPPSSTDAFTDDESSTFENDINALAASGITTGCTPTTYCPEGLVTREQMAAFLHRAMD